MAGSSSRSRADLRARTREVARVLNRSLGRPALPRRRARPLDMLIATILSQNTADRNSHRAWRELRRRFPDWASAAAAPPAALRAAIRPGGMAALKTLTIRRTLAHVRSRFGAYDLGALAGLTDDAALAELTAVKGVGVKTAACVLLFSLGRNVFPVDTHVHRVCTRLGLVPRPGTPERTFQGMRDLVRRRGAYALHTNMIRLGRTVCRAQRPACGSCPLCLLCRAPERRRHRGIRLERARTGAGFMALDHVEEG